jgi:Ca2+-binding RTX toxin-like protein
VSVYTASAVVSRGTDGADQLNGNFYPTQLYGLGGDDRLFGTGTEANRMDGGPGNDTIESGGLMLGGEGDDRLTSAIANDILVRQDGGPGNDLMIGRYGNDRLTGGPGADRMSGGSGNDYLNARDGERDSVRCGDGRKDRVVADRVDSVARDCERVTRR